MKWLSEISVIFFLNVLINKQLSFLYGHSNNAGEIKGREANTCSRVKNCEIIWRLLSVGFNSATHALYRTELVWQRV